MDPGVLEAMRRWPNVPAAYGWLSLTPRGEWRLHPAGDAMLGGPGQGISNEQILRFIDRNYLCNEEGCWFFQNGPQRVFVRIDAAPLILRADPNTGQLITHVGRVIEQVHSWKVDEVGRLFAQSDAGPGILDDRDLMAVCEVLQSHDGQSLIDLLETAAPHCPSEAGDPASNPSSAGDKASLLFDPTGTYAALEQLAPLDWVASRRIPASLGFVANPGPTGNS